MEACRHYNIAQLFGIGKSVTQPSHFYVLEELFTAGTLSERMNRGLLNAAEAQLIGAQLIDAVAHIASHDLVHRDIKPDNILFRADGAPVLDDFGIVRDLRNVSLTGSWQPQGPGTPVFSSPEQLKNEKAMIDWRSDQFSLGVTLGVALFGIHPYDRGAAAPTVDAMGQRSTQSPDFIAAARGRWATLIKMTSAWPHERYRKPSDLAEAWQSAAFNG